MKLLCFGEVVWDEIQGQRYIGGGPFNVAAHARILGVEEVYLFSAVGSDELGRTTREKIREAGIRDDFVGTASDATCLVKATLDERGTATFTIPDPTSFDQIEVGEKDIRRIRDMQFDCLYFGTIAQRRLRTRDSLRRLVAQCGFKHTFCDVNLRMDFYSRDVLDWSLRHLDTLKLNEEELLVLGRLFGFDQQEPHGFCKWLHETFGIRWVFLTGGEKGAWSYSPSAFVFHPAVPAKVVDTVGPGDAFSAAVISKLYNNVSASDACAFGCRVGSLVVSRRGAVPQYSLSEIQ